MDTRSLVAAASQPKTGQEAESSNPQGLSKKAQKRAAKAARLHELKLERRAREKVAKKNKRRERAQAISSGELVENTSRKRRGTNAGGETEIFNARVVVDLGFDELMSDKEINSLTSQLAYTYSANRHAAHAFSALIFTSLNGRTKQRLDAINDAGYRRWSRTEWWEGDYDRLWTEPSEPLQSPSEAEDAQGSLALAAQADRKNIVYLTADSSEELLELNEGETYIIGGICDHNRYKNLCLNKAIDSQIRHARLPIGRYITLATRKVLTVNQVFEILLKWIDTRNWEDAFWAVIPKRKLQGGRQDDQGGGGKDGNTEQDDDGGRRSDTDDEEAMHTKGEAKGCEIETSGKKGVVDLLGEMRDTSV
ncbi:guanine-1-methyltransferase-domain-containing protein [Lanmaoa asiatica]|nr:guanine-1-methyltransferase-domain-containing protein [Lanmaoa asiatica]